MKKKVFLFCFFPLFLHAVITSYQVDFEGVDDPQILKLLKNESQLIVLKGKPLASYQALKYRADSDIPQLLKVLHAQGYYDAIITAHIEEVYKDSPLVILKVSLGTRYTIESFNVTFQDGPLHKEAISFDAESLGIHLHSFALSLSVLEAEEKLKKTLANHGYPLAKIQEEQVVVDGRTKTMSIQLIVEHGPLCVFGSYRIEGLKRTKASFLNSKIAWKEGEVFSQELVDETRNNLIDTTLFSIVLIDLDTSGNTCKIPLIINVTETKYRSIGFGASYQTQWGAGGNFLWENRNVGGKGAKLILDGDVTQRSITGVVGFTIPDCLAIGQDMTWQAKADSISVPISFSAQAYSLSWTLEKRLSKHFSLSIGAKGQKLFVEHSVQNSKNWLVSSPLYLRFNTTDSLLNPTQGFKTHYHAKPTLVMERPFKPYVYQEARLCTYWPVYKGNVIFAQMFTIGSILSENLAVVPVAERLFGSVEDNLRGYRFMTVSPLNHDRKPKGGRAALYYTFESRFRLNKSFGVVPFFDVGRVNTGPIPSIWGRYYKSVGLGFRYFTFFGPFRLDIGVPLDRRKGIDPPFRILASIGQTF